MSLSTLRATPWKSTTAFAVISPAITTSPVLQSVSAATRARGSFASTASSTASDTWSATLSGCPSLTDSEVNRKLLLMGSLRSSFPAARDHEGLVVEPQAAVLLQHGLRHVEVVAVGDDAVQALVLDLVDVDRGVPGGEQRRGADAVADLVRQRVHLVAEDGFLVGLRGQRELSG